MKFSSQTIDAGARPQVVSTAVFAMRFSRKHPLAILRFVMSVLAVYFLMTGVSLADNSGTAPFTVGLVVPLTGPTADYGIAIRNCISLAQHDHPELFSQIQFRYEDAGYDTKTAVTALNKLIDGDRINLAGTWGVSFCKALAPIAEARKMPLAGICLDPGIAANKRYVLRFLNTTDEIMEAQARYLNDRGIKRLGILLAQHPYLEEAIQALKRSLKAGQSITVIDEIPNAEMDLRTDIAKIERRKNEFDMLGVFLSVGQISTFYKQAHDLKLDMNSFGTDWFESLSEIKASAGTMNGAIFSSIEINPEFLKRYREQFHNESQLAFGAPAYEFAVTVGSLFGGGGTGFTADEIMNKFSTVKGSGGTASGPYTYVDRKETGKYFRFPVSVKKITGDSFESLP